MIYIQVPSCGDGYVNLSAVFLFLRFYLHGFCSYLRRNIHRKEHFYKLNKSLLFFTRNEFTFQYLQILNKTPDVHLFEMPKAQNLLQTSFAYF